MPMLRLLIADDQEYLREGVRRILVDQPDISVVAVAENGTEALALTLSHLPDVVLLDIRMPHLNGVEVAQQVRIKQPQIGLLLLSQYDDLAYVHQFLGNDSARKGYLLKSTLSDVKALVQAIRAVASGQLVLDPQLAERLFQTSSAGLNQLTKRELRILAEMARGLDNQAIAESLVIEQSTVENHINSIYSKLDIGQSPGYHRRVEAVLRFLKGS
jgi:DNA-binding NarL/FixJ family response regulator